MQVLIGRFIWERHQAPGILLNNYWVLECWVLRHGCYGKSSCSIPQLSQALHLLAFPGKERRSDPNRRLLPPGTNLPHKQPKPSEQFSQLAFCVKYCNLWFPKCGPLTSSICITWKLARNAHSGALLTDLCPLKQTLKQAQR